MRERSDALWWHPNQMNCSFGSVPVLYGYVTEHPKFHNLKQPPFYHAQDSVGREFDRAWGDEMAELCLQ